MPPQILIARIFLALAGFAAVIALGATVWHYTPVIGSGARYARLEADRDEWKKDAVAWMQNARGWKASAEASEALRGREQRVAVAAAASQIQQCASRVQEARASARTIERIVTRSPSYDANRCPVRQLVDPGQLREALSPGSGSDR